MEFGLIVIAAQAFPPRPGGIQYLLEGTARYIAKCGHAVTVLADGDSARRARGINIKTHLMTSSALTDGDHCGGAQKRGL